MPLISAAISAAAACPGSLSLSPPVPRRTDGRTDGRAELANGPISGGAVHVWLGRQSVSQPSLARRQRQVNNTYKEDNTGNDNTFINSD